MEQDFACKNCIYWASSESGHDGLCRRRSPAANFANYGEAVWPKTYHSDWCGDGQMTTGHQVQYRRGQS